MLCNIFFVLLRYCYYVLSTSHLYPSRILFLHANTSCILHLLCVGYAIDHCGWSSLHCMSGWASYLINVHCGHSLRADLVWSCYVYMLYSVYKLNRTLLAYIRTMYSTYIINLMKVLFVCKCFRLQVYMCKYFTASGLGVSEFCHYSQTHV